VQTFVDDTHKQGGIVSIKKSRMHQKIWKETVDERNKE